MVIRDSNLFPYSCFGIRIFLFINPLDSPYPSVQQKMCNMDSLIKEELNKDEIFPGTIACCLQTLILSANFFIIPFVLWKRKTMDSNLSDSALLQHLEDIASRIGIEVRYDTLSDEEISIRSGGCKLLGRNLILIDSRHPTEERARILARELSKFDLEDLYILPRVREFIFLQSSPREKNLPQR